MSKDWTLEDWEMEFQKDEAYALERQKDIERSWEEWEYKNKKPAKIKLIIKKKKHEHKHLPL